MKNIINVELSEQELKQALLNYINENNKLKFSDVSKVKFINGSVQVTEPFTHVQCKVQLSTDAPQLPKSNIFNRLNVL